MIEFYSNFKSFLFGHDVLYTVVLIAFAIFLWYEVYKK